MSAPSEVSPSRRAPKQILWSAFRILLMFVHATYGAWWRTHLRHFSPSVMHHARLLRTGRWVHRLDSVGNRVGFGRGVSIQGPLRIHLADGAAVLDGVILSGTGVLRVGVGSSIGHDSAIVARETVTIGARCMIAGRCYILDVDHEFVDSHTPIPDQGLRIEPVHIGDDVWIGAQTVVLRGVTIGDGCVVGANSVVTTDLPAGTVAVGSPAKVVGRRT